MRRKTLALAELALATKIRELQDLERTIDVSPRIAERRIPFVLAQIEDLRKMIRIGHAEQARYAAVEIVREIKRQSAIRGDDRLTCEACDWSHPMPEASRVLNVHHVVPIAAGGSNESSNLVLICPNCHATAHSLLGRGLSPANRDEFLLVLKSDPLSS
jgi:hypothetical protein